MLRESAMVTPVVRGKVLKTYEMHWLALGYSLSFFVGVCQMDAVRICIRNPLVLRLVYRLSPRCNRPEPPDARKP